MHFMNYNEVKGDHVMLSGKLNSEQLGFTSVTVTLSDELKQWFSDYKIEYSLPVIDDWNFEISNYIEYIDSPKQKHLYEIIGIEFKNIKDAILFKLRWC